MTNAPSTGSAPSVHRPPLANEVPLSFGIQSAFDAFIKAGQLHSLAVTAGTRQGGR
jgi:hypothetical protein